MGEETLSGDGYVYYVDYFDDFMGVYICQYFNALNVLRCVLGPEEGQFWRILYVSFKRMYLLLLFGWIMNMS